MAFRTVLLFLLVGFWMAGSAAGAVLVAGKRPQLDRWAIGSFLWGVAIALLIMVDCVRPWPGIAANLAGLLYLVGGIGGLVGLNWPSRPSLRWLWTLLMAGLTFVPFFLLSVINALCHFT
jgi:hypothetical protein